MVEFRGWDVDSGEMIYNDPTLFITLDGVVLRDGKVQNIILQQFTGLEDPKQIKMYEGDIVATCFRNIVAEVVRCGDMFRGFGWKLYSKENDEFYDIGLSREVLGNIYESDRDGVRKEHLKKVFEEMGD